MIGIYGGTFDPIHFGHLRTALEVKQALNLDELRFLPCGLPAHKDQPSTTSDMRLQMLSLALQGSDFCIDSREIERPGPSYMVDTLNSIRLEINETPLCLILGQDAFAQLPCWHLWRQLFDLAHIIVMRRPGSQEIEFSEALASAIQGRRVEACDDLQSNPFGKVYFLEVTQLAISATDIRQMLSKAQSPRYLLPDAVLALIQTKGLYRSRG